PGSEQEWRLRHLAGGDALADEALDTAVELIHARRAEEFTRFDGNLESVVGLPDYADGTALISPTALERFAGCPHAFFVERMLNVKPLETPEEIITIRPWDLGSMVHEVMDRLTTEAELLPGYGEPWSAADRERMREIMAEVMADYERRGLTGHPRLWDRERERLHQDLEAILDLDDEAHHTRDSRVVASELSFGMRGHTPVRIELGTGAIAMRGSADRVDETRGGTLIVTDFKTGSSGGFTDIHEDPVVAGKKLQLPLYAHAARAAFGNDTVEAGYWFIGRRDRGKRVDVRLDANLEKIYREALETLVTGIREGRFIARPPASDDFSWVQCAFCNPDGVGYGHVRGSSERKRTDPALAGLFSLLDPSVLPATNPSGETSE
ncbi:PD-(D/E)XK nuclease family protein, partial [Microbacterium sp.]|uniref:PD-(D/E)XK nuclease family protein n=1 Tax=Microbacterium sp. TaxID=51671 RepID=UPI003C21DEDA